MNQKVKRVLSSVLIINFIIFTVVEGLRSNNASVKIIRTDNGDIYECIDANKQPSLLHPALKDHKVQGLSTRNETSRVAGIGLKEGCPPGYVPIQTQMSKIISTNVASGYDPNARFAGLITKQTAPRLHPITGSFAAYDIHKPKVGPTQRSSGFIALESDVFGYLSRIEAGWMVNPGLFGDDRTRLYAGWVEASDSTTSGCYNTVCPGFIVTSNTIQLGYAFPYISDPGGRKYDVTFDIKLREGRWMLVVNGEQVGYWPSEIVPHLNPYTLKVRWGGEVLKPDPNDATKPEMGDGNYKRKWEFDYNAYVRQIILAHEENTWLTPHNDEVELYWYECYRAKENEYRSDRDLGYSFVYGGTDALYFEKC